jgi:hypothetical protein
VRRLRGPLRPHQLGPGHPGLLRRVVSLDPSSLDDVLDGALQAGKAAGVQEQADEVVTGLRERLASFRATVDGLERRRVFALEWDDPPFNGGHWIPEMLQVAGAEPVLACPGAPSVRVSWAQIEAAAPQVVVFMPCGYDLRAAVDEGAGPCWRVPSWPAPRRSLPSTPAPSSPVRVRGWWMAWRSSPRRSTQDGCPYHHRKPPCDSGDRLDQPGPGARGP